MGEKGNALPSDDLGSADTPMERRTVKPIAGTEVGLEHDPEGVAALPVGDAAVAQL